MPFRKALGLALLYLGVIITLFGLLAMVLPTLENEQLQLILASFEAPAPNGVLGFINQQFLNMIKYHTELLIVGGVLALIGIVLLLFSAQTSTRRDSTRKSAVASQKRRSKAMPLPADSQSPRTDWRRPSPVPSSPLDHVMDDALPYKDFSPMLTVQEPAKKAPKPSAVQGNNPYFSYGQSAYTPPPKFDSSLQDYRAPKPMDPSPYEKPASLKKKEAAEAATPLEALPSNTPPLEEPVWPSQPSLAFHTPDPPKPLPAFTDTEPTPIAACQIAIPPMTAPHMAAPQAVSPHMDAPSMPAPQSLPPQVPVPQMSAPQTVTPQAPAPVRPIAATKRLSPALRLDSESGPAPESRRILKPQYLSGRIRSTIRKKGAEA